MHPATKSIAALQRLFSAEGWFDRGLNEEDVFETLISETVHFLKHLTATVKSSLSVG